MVNIAVLVSGGGTNLQALIDAQAAGALANGRLCAVISSKEGAYALERAKAAGIPPSSCRRRTALARPIMRTSWPSSSKGWTPGSSCWPGL